MKNYIEFIKWCISGISLKDEVSRMFLYFGVAFLGSLAFGYPEYWFMAMLCAIVVELAVGTVQFKYRDFLREKQDNDLMDLDG